MILRLLTLSKVDPLPVLNYAHNCNTPLLSLISMMMMIMTMMTIRMMMMMIMLKKYVDFSTRDVVVQKLNFFAWFQTQFKIPQIQVLVLDTWVLFILVTVNIVLALQTYSYTCTTPRCGSSQQLSFSATQFFIADFVVKNCTSTRLPIYTQIPKILMVAPQTYTYLPLHPQLWLSANNCHFLI